MKLYRMLSCQKNIYNIEMKYRNTGVCNLGGLICFNNDINSLIIKKSCIEVLKNNSNFHIKVSESGDIYFDNLTDYAIDEYDFTDKDENAVSEILKEWMDESLFGRDKFLFDIRLVKTSSGNGLFVKVHHIIGDGFSVAIFTRKIWNTYVSFCNNTYSPDYDDYYMRKIIDNNRDNVCPLQDEISKGQNSYRIFENEGASCESGLINITLKEDYKKLRAYIKKNHISSEILFLTAMLCIIGMDGKFDSICIGRNKVGRSGVDYKSMGMFVDTKSFDISMPWCKADTDIIDYMKDIKETFVKSEDKQGTVKDSLDMIISYRPGKLMETFDGGSCIEIYNSFVEVPLKLLIKEMSDNISLDIKYQKSLFDDKKAEQIAGKVLSLIKEIINKTDEKLRILDIDICDENDNALYKSLNDVRHEMSYKSLLKSFCDMAEKYPDKTALVSENESFTYREMYGLVQKTASYILDRADSGKEKIAAVRLDRGIWQPIVVFGAFMAGFAYLPLKNEDSIERLQYVTDRCGVTIDQTAINTIMTYENTYDIDEMPGFKTDMHAPAYYMFTSGTTGRPKAVAISHKSLDIRIRWHEKTFIDGIEVGMHKTNTLFDVSMWELVLFPTSGSTLVVVPEGAEKDPVKLADFIEKYNVTMVHFVPSMFTVFLKYIKAHKYSFEKIKYIILSGERLDASNVRMAKDLMPRVDLYNLYGPTECTIDVSYCLCDDSKSVIPIGRPVWNTEISVVNGAGKRLPVNVTGELVVYGDLVGKYSHIFSDSASCKARAFNNASASGNDRKSGYKRINGKECYYTGDLVHIGEDGNLYYDGRMDSQKKIHGMRISVSDLETYLNEVFDEGKHIIICENDNLTDYYTGDLSVDKIKNSIRRRFPYYYVPAHFVKISEVPVTKSGKTDRKKLVSMYANETVTKSDSDFCRKEDWEKERIISLLTRLAKKYAKRNISTLDNMYDMGMDSINRLEFMLECEKYGLMIPYNAFVEKKNIKELADYLYINKKDNNEELLYFNKKGNEELLFFVSFAGGSPLSFAGISGLNDNDKYDFCVVNMKGYEDITINEAGKSVAEKIAAGGYKRVHLVSSCVGSSMIISVARHLGENVGEIFICESLPYEGLFLGGRLYTIWDFMCDGIINAFLVFIRRKRFKADKRLLKDFRRDVYKSAEYLNYFTANELTPLKRKVNLIFGKKDFITKGYKKKYGRWRKYIKGDFELYEIADAGHFLVEDNAREVYDIISKVLNK